MRFVNLIIAFVFASLQLKSQDSIYINGTLLHNTKFAKVVVKQFGVGVFDIAAVPIKEGVFTIAAPLNLQAGVYRFQYSQSSLNEYVDVIINGKEKQIAFTLNLQADVENCLPIFIHSVENKNWYNYLARQKKEQERIIVLDALLANYKPVNQPFYVAALKHRNQLVASYRVAQNAFVQKNKGSWAAAMVANRPVYFANPAQHWKIQAFNKNENYWAGINTTMPALINSPLYTEHILNYVQYYLDPQQGFGEAEMKEGFKKCTDTIVARFGANDTTRRFAINYLQAGFRDIGQEDALQYIDEKYAQHEQCSSTEPDSALQKRLMGYQTIKPGNIAPEIYLTDSTGNKKSLTQLPQENIVLVFWASWCPHCQEQMPQVNEWAAKQTNTLVLAISLDDDVKAYRAAIAAYPNVAHVCDLKKWEGKTVQDYFITATPTIIKLNKERKIVGKYKSLAEMK